MSKDSVQNGVLGQSVVLAQRSACGSHGHEPQEQRQGADAGRALPELLQDLDPLQALRHMQSLLSEEGDADEVGQRGDVETLYAGLQEVVGEELPHRVHECEQREHHEPAKQLNIDQQQGKRLPDQHK